MIKIASKLTPQKIKQAVYQLNPPQRIRLLEDLEDSFFPGRLRQIVSVLRSKAKTSSLNKITKITQKIRKRLYEETQGRH